MANVTISQLNSASTPLTGSEVVPVVQSGSTKKVTVQSIADLAAGGGGNASIEIQADGTVVSQNSNVMINKGAVVRSISGNQTVVINEIPQLYLGSGGTATYITLPNLTVAGMIISNAANLVTINLPVYVEAYNTGMAIFSIYNNPSLTTINIPALTIIPSNAWFDFSGNALPEASIDALLVKFASSTATNSSLYLHSGTNAAPSATGLAAKAVLVGRGWTVNHN